MAKKAIKLSGWCKAIVHDQHSDFCHIIEIAWRHEILSEFIKAKEEFGRLNRISGRYRVTAWSTHLEGHLTGESLQTGLYIASLNLEGGLN